jgi:uncharacterized protein (TIGR03089 family)
MQRLTAGLVGERDPAQPLLTYLDGPARVELSGTTTANWVAKTANLLHDGYGGPDRVGLLLPLHWQTVCLLLGGVAAGSTVVVARTPDELAGCPVAFVSGVQVEGALDAGVEDVLACSMTPWATRTADLPAMVLDAAAELPGYGDHYPGGPPPGHVELGGQDFVAESLALDSSDRVLVTRDPASREGLSALLGSLASGSALILLKEGDRQAAIASEGATAGFDESGRVERY